VNGELVVSAMRELEEWFGAGGGGNALVSNSVATATPKIRRWNGASSPGRGNIASSSPSSVAKKTTLSPSWLERRRQQEAATAAAGSPSPQATRGKPSAVEAVSPLRSTSRAWKPSWMREASSGAAGANAADVVVPGIYLFHWKL